MVLKEDPVSDGWKEAADRMNAIFASGTERQDRFYKRLEGVPEGSRFSFPVPVMAVRIVGGSILGAGLPTFATATFLGFQELTREGDCHCEQHPIFVGVATEDGATYQFSPFPDPDTIMHIS
jgi:hypothetical protein